MFYVRKVGHRASRWCGGKAARSHMADYRIQVLDFVALEFSGSVCVHAPKSRDKNGEQGPAGGVMITPLCLHGVDDPVA